MKSMNRTKKLAILSLGVALAAAAVFVPGYTALAGPASRARMRAEFADGIVRDKNVDAGIRLVFDTEPGWSPNDRMAEFSLDFVPNWDEVCEFINETNLTAFGDRPFVKLGKKGSAILDVKPDTKCVVIVRWEVPVDSNDELSGWAPEGVLVNCVELVVADGETHTRPVAFPGMIENELCMPKDIKGIVAAPLATRMPRCAFPSATQS